jgi:hypothetical protein
MERRSWPASQQCEGRQLCLVGVALVCPLHQVGSLVDEDARRLLIPQPHTGRPRTWVGMFGAYMRYAYVLSIAVLRFSGGGPMVFERVRTLRFEVRQKEQA